MSQQGFPLIYPKVTYIFSFQFSMPRAQKKCITHRRNPHTELQAIFCNFKLSFWIWFESVESLTHLCQSFNFLFAKSRMGFQSLSVDCRDSSKFFYHFTHIKEIYEHCLSVGIFPWNMQMTATSFAKCSCFIQNDLKNEIYPHIYGLIWHMVSTKQKILEEN